ncbi:DoxX family protein [Mucilaginibacter ginkgonis]|uniref:DoxX family protein n=1 Tax=Mucilaginibacter ginkgonis TaxID=2682091 RepID=A0A6I4HZX3_9SPHI|nr:MauE/DoxX family redox-associated membrane protein [Mucilaginibacter ginkgonis]QQL49491.1 DoxX family protein [Mucilaginibacter ginkgonis]
MNRPKQVSLIITIVFYIGAGINHFVHPDGYISIIPHYIPYPVTMNYMSGACEIVFAILAIFKSTRPTAGWLIVLMLAAFIPVHVTMAVDSPLHLGKILVTPFWAWVRVLFQPVLMYWAWWSTRLTPTLPEEEGVYVR